MRFYDPFDALLRLQEEIDRAFERPGRPTAGLTGGGAFPPVNVFRGREGYVARFEVPGVTPENLSIETQGTTLTLSGKREPREAAEGSLHRRECWSGEFSRSVQLPEDADPTAATASCRNGILTVEIPQREEARPRRIQVRAAS